MPQTLEGHAVLTITEVAEYLRISRGLAYELAKTGELPSLQLGRRKVVPVPALLKKLELQDSKGA